MPGIFAFRDSAIRFFRAETSCENIFTSAGDERELIAFACACFYPEKYKKAGRDFRGEACPGALSAWI